MASSVAGSGRRLISRLAKISGAWLITGNGKHYPPVARNGVTAKSPTDYLAFIKPR